MPIANPLLADMRKLEIFKIQCARVYTSVNQKNFRVKFYDMRSMPVSRREHCNALRKLGWTDISVEASSSGRTKSLTFFASR